MRRFAQGQTGRNKITNALAGGRIGVDVASLPEEDAQEEPGALATSTGAMRIVMRALLEQRLESHPPDIFIEPESRVYGALDFAKLPEILAEAAPARGATLAGLKGCSV